MKDKIIKKATDLFMKLGFKSVTMDDIACEMCISKKTIYKYFGNKEELIEEGTTAIQNQIHETIDAIVSNNHNAIVENFEIRKMFNEMFQYAGASPLFQLKKHYPEIYNSIIHRQIQECRQCFTKNIEKGISEGLYRNNLNVAMAVKFYYELNFSINDQDASEKEINEMEFEAMEYHIRAIATEKGIEELENQLQNHHKNN